MLFYTFLEREAARCTSIRELLKYHDELSSSIDSIQVSIEKLETKKTQTDKIKWQIKDLKVEKEEKELLMNTFYKGFFFFTVPLSVKHRSENLRRMSECVAAFELIEGTGRQQAAVKLLASLNSSAIQVVSDTRGMLDLLALSPLGSVDDEESILGDLGILPGMAFKPNTDWLVNIYETYCSSQSVVEEEIHFPDTENVFSSPTSPSQKKKWSDDEDDVSRNVADVTLDEKNDNDQEEVEVEKSEVASKPEKCSSEDKLNLLTSSQTAAEKQAESERNRKLLFGD